MAMTLNVIGGGRAGRTLARVFSQNGIFAIGDVLDRTPALAADAVAFIGSGRAIGALAEMRRAAVWMLTPPDDQIDACGQALAASGRLEAGNVVFHCSGATPSRELKAVLPANVATASIHPLRTFADPALAAQTFNGTYCAAEGDAAALAVLTPAFETAGARLSRIDPASKTIYHAASVIVCNYLTALMEAGLRSYEKAGLQREEALRMMEPLVRETVDNVFRLGTVDALTGPIARGDHVTVKRQEAALAAWNGNVADLYRDLGRIAVELAQAQGQADPAALAIIMRGLQNRE
jgi:predicted short-subunit dehydrogenase-like oxidoreductase (DUF2520 family)